MTNTLIQKARAGRIAALASLQQHQTLRASNVFSLDAARKRRLDAVPCQFVSRRSATACPEFDKVAVAA